METILHAFITNIYWFSLPLIGYAILLFLANVKLSSFLGNLSQIALKQHFFVGFIISFAVTYFIISVLSLPLYLFHMPAVISSVAYAFLLAVSVLYVLFSWGKQLFSTSDIHLFSLSKQTLFVKILFISMCFIIVADFLLTVFVAKAFPWGDGVYHMARVMSMVHDGFNVQTSYFQNVPESGYMYNAFYTLFIIPATLLNLDAMKVWEYSLGFFRILLWFSIFTLAATVFRDWLKAKGTWLLFSILAVLSAIAINAAGFFVANYPSRLAFVWFILLVILLSYSSNKTARAVRLLIITVSFMLAMTHIIYAVIAACFLVLVTVVKLLILGKSYLSRSTLITAIASVGILLSTPVIAKLLPVRASEDLIHLMGAPSMDVIGGMKILIPMFPATPIDWFVYIVGIAGILGAINILRVSKSKHEMSILISLFSFYILIAHIPFIFSLMYKILPMWVIQRFDSMNVAQYISFALGVYVIYYYALLFRKKYAKRFIAEWKYDRIIIVLLVVATILTSMLVADGTYRKLIDDRKEKQVEYQFQQRSAKELRDILNENKLIVTTPTYSYIFTSLFNVDILAVEYGHSPLASDGANRSLCQEHILKNLGFNELNAIGANYLFQVASDKESTAGSKPYLKLVKQNQEFKIYEVQKNYNSENNETYQPCVEFQKREKS